MPIPDVVPAPPRLIVALVTPFTSDQRLDRASLGRLVGHLVTSGVREFFAAGSTGESPLIDDDDRLAIVETVRQAAPTARIYAGVSASGYRAAIRLTRAVRVAGADVAVLMSPYFLNIGPEPLTAYCAAVADSGELPLALYHHLRMPTAFDLDTVARLAAHPRIIAIKDTNGADDNRCAAILAATAGHNFEFLQGVEKLVLPTLEAGGHGCVVAQGNIAPQLFLRLIEAWRSGDLPTARAAQERITALWAIFSRPEVRKSFPHFLHTLKLPLLQRGLIASAASATPGVRFDAAYEKMLAEFMATHLEPAAAAPAE